MSRRDRRPPARRWRGFRLFAIEADIRGRNPVDRQDARRRRSAPILAELKAFFDATLAAISGKSSLAGAIRYATSRWAALTRFVDDGRLEMTNNAAERDILQQPRHMHDPDKIALHRHRWRQARPRL